MAGADLTNARLTNCVLAGADLTDCVLAGADLTNARLTNCVLTNCVLAGADLTNARLAGADLTDCVLPNAQLNHAVLTGAVLTGAVLPHGVPVVDALDARILERISGNGCQLNMGEWHTCETTHCRAGWAIVLAGDAGAALERKYGPSAAGALIYAASRPGIPVPDFYCDTETALADIKKHATV